MSPSKKKARVEIFDDSREEVYKSRIDEFEQKQQLLTDEKPPDEIRFDPDSQIELESGLLIGTDLYEHLYPHQQIGVNWLYQLNQQRTGGILGDEMGLGKTIQMCSYLSCFEPSQHTTLVVCPASVLYNWLREFHKWAPRLRVVMLHGSAIQAHSKRNANRTTKQKKSARQTPYKKLIDLVVDESFDNEGGGVLLTTYSTVRTMHDLLLPVEWDYVILDEGHRIRNPDAEITLICKQLHTVNRIILTGSPIQNNLRELWSLFDFVFPGRLGTLPAFEDEFGLPIKAGGYANASKMQLLMAYKCSLTLHDLIKPYLLHRLKKNLENLKLPSKCEQVLFCNLTPFQIEAYQSILLSSEVKKVLNREVKPFRAMMLLRHICNHPDLIADRNYQSRLCSEQTTSALNKKLLAQSFNQNINLDDGEELFDVDEIDDDERFDFENLSTNNGMNEFLQKSGKMIVLNQVLPMWYEQKHRVLLFTQTRKMLNIMEKYCQYCNYGYCRLDGTTPVKQRQSLIDEFNKETDNSKLFIFLLTTRAGGIGINLTGASRVLIFDPDWNPSTDIQARERAYRLGQTKNVTIYRLITHGTIEEKIYHRQLYKNYLSQKVLHNPKQKNSFKKNTRNQLMELFTLSIKPAEDELDTKQSDSFNSAGTETADLFYAGHVSSATNVEHEELDGKLLKNSDGYGKDCENVEKKNKKRDFSDVESSSENEDGEYEKRQQKTDSENNNILKKIMEGCRGIQSVFSHDEIEKSDSHHNQEFQLIEMEATKVAESALATLTESKKQILRQKALKCQNDSFGLTWTGKNGTLGRSSINNSNRAGFSLSGDHKDLAMKSKDLLDRIKRKKAEHVQYDRASYQREEKKLTVEQMAEMLYVFFLENGKKQKRKQFSTNEILMHFNRYISTVEQKIAFRNLLRKMATYNRNKTWSLK